MKQARVGCDRTGCDVVEHFPTTAPIPRSWYRVSHPVKNVRVAGMPPFRGESYFCSATCLAAWAESSTPVTYGERP